jgi:hypothetical protein
MAMVKLLRAYFLYIHDDRYGTPTLEVVTADNDEAVHDVARERLVGSVHHLLVEIWTEDDRHIGRVSLTSGA